MGSQLSLVDGDRPTQKLDSWSRHLELRSRFQRSVHLERDSGSGKWLNGYLLTPLVVSTIGRIAEGLCREDGNRAWSLTGPYGTGKSAFSLFLTHALGLPENEGGARERLRSTESQLAELLFDEEDGPLSGTGFLPVVAVGERRPLDQIILRALHQTAVEFWPTRKPEVVTRIAELMARAESESVAPREVVEVLEELAQKVGQSQRAGAGLLLVLDEGGKPLEFAAQSPMRGDVQLLQEIAEAANRPNQQASIVFVVTLHQALESYASGLSASQRSEWAKVHGRFEDIAFQEHNDQLLRLIGQAIKLEGDVKRHLGGLKKLAAEVVSATRLRAQDRSAADLLSECVPLNPVTALTLGPLFRGQIGQNERSLFAFLASAEPHGFGDFARQLAESLPLYTVDRLYDYVRAALGARLYGMGGRHWSMVEEALQRLPEDADPMDARVIKALGVLTSLRETAGLSATAPLLGLALCERASDLKPTKQAVLRSLRRLRDSKVVLHQSFRERYQLWDGSDLDLDTRLSEAFEETRNSVNLVQRVTRLVEPRPVMARRHFFETGTLRYFDIRYKSSDSVDDQPVAEPGESDGEVWLLLPSSKHEADSACRALEAPRVRAPSERPLVVLVPENVEVLYAYGRELVALEWIERNTPELQGDAVGRRELKSRLTEVKNLLRREVSELLGGHRPTRWFFEGKEEARQPGQTLARFLSDVCDRTYPKAPRVHNELLNRSKLSSAAAAARRNLLEGVVERAELPRLGIEGTPPELSMYRSALEGEIHRELNGEWKLTVAEGGAGISGVLLEIERYLSMRDEMLVEVPEIYAHLALPPFGVKLGLAPVALIALLAIREGELAVYEDGVFVPRLDGPLIERLVRGAKTFCVQRTPLTAARRTVLDAYFRLTEGKGQPSVLGIVRGLVRFAGQLPDYTRNTRTLSEEARGVREVLLRAKQPSKLLYRDIPEALGLEPFELREVDVKAVSELESRLRAALKELQDAYPSMLEGFRQAVFRAFGQAADAPTARETLGKRAEVVRPSATSTALTALLIRLEDSSLDDATWLTSVATFLGKKPPTSWYDRDLDAARTQLRLAADEYEGLEAISLESRAPAALQVVLVSAQESGQAKHQRVVALAPEESALVEKLEAEILSLAARYSEDPRVVLGALGLAATKKIAQTEDTAADEEAAPSGAAGDEESHVR